MSLTATDVAKLLAEKIKSYEPKTVTSNVGIITQIGDSIVKIHGLSGVAMGEMIEFTGGTYGLVLNLEEDSVGALLLDPNPDLKEGDEVKTTGKIMEIPVGDALIGRVVNALGQPIDGKGKIATTGTRLLEVKAPGIHDRKGVDTPLQTGIKAIDAMIPVGRGQRELIIGDRQTGKTAIAIDTILNQKGQNCLCVYVAIGQKASTVAKLVARLEEAGAMEYTTVVVANASDEASLQFVAPYAGVTIAEEWMWKGKDVLIVYDDLSKHAAAYRQIALLLRRPPGREAYPGDVFYVHSRLLERAARLSDAHGGGSITALPIIETQANDVSAYIPTNVISITDGQIYLEADLFYKGIRPAINAGLSVSRVGGAAQTKAMKAISGGIRLALAQFRELEAFAQFGSDLDESTRRQIERGKRVVEILKQPQYLPRPLYAQLIIIFAANEGYLDDVAVEQIIKFEQELAEYMHSTHASVVHALEKGDKKIEGDLKNELIAAIEKFKLGWK